MYFSNLHVRTGPVWLLGLAVGLVLLPSGCWLANAWSDVKVERIQDPARKGARVFRFMLTPAAESEPAFRYRFTVPLVDRIPGNAVTHYLRADGEGSLRTPLKSAQDRYGQVIYDWSSLEREQKDINLDHLRDVSQMFDGFVNDHIRRATLCRESDWGLALEQLSGREMFSFPLPSVQQTRSISRMLMLRNRLAVIEGRYQDSVDHLRMNYQLAVNVNEVGLLVSSLVAVAENSMGNRGAMHLIGAKGSPNLYWALAGLPRPVVDLRQAFQLEASFGLRFFEDLQEVESLELSEEAWNAKLDQVLDQIAWWRKEVYGDQQAALPGNSFNKAAFKLGIGLVAYPQAKQKLIASGMDPKNVEAMPVAQVLLLEARNALLASSDEVEKSYCLTFPELNRYYAGRNKRRKAPQSLGEVMVDLVSPASQQVRDSQVRVQAEINVLMTIESIRNHVAQQGKLPESLEVLTLPAPLNPYTDKPFPYKVNEGVAQIELEGAPIYFRNQYVLKFED